MRKLFALTVCAALMPALAAANDSSASLAAGGLVLTKNSEVAMRSEDLAISPKRIGIDYVFENTSATDKAVLIAFPLPDIDMGAFWEEPLGTTTGNAVNFLGFKVWQDGKPVAVDVEQRAFLKDRDVTAQVKAAGLPVNVLTKEGIARVDHLPPETLKTLAAQGLADLGDAPMMPLWTVRTKFFWRQNFPAHQTVKLHQTYQPVTGQSFYSSYEADNPKDETAKAYCFDSGAKAAIGAKLAAVKTRPDPLLNAYRTDYILTTARNWAGPIGHFHLTLDKLKPSNVLSLCWNGTLTKTGPARFEFQADNFTPSQEVRLLVLE